MKRDANFSMDKVTSMKDLINDYQSTKLPNVDERMQELYAPGKTTPDVIWDFWLGLKSRWYFFIAFFALIGAFFIAWYVCTFLLFTVAIGILISWWFVSDNSLWFVDLTSDGVITPISVGREAFKEMRKRKMPVNNYVTAKGDLLFLTYNYEKGKSLMFAESHLRNPFTAMFDARQYEGDSKQLEVLIERELKLFSNERIINFRAQRTFADKFTNMWEKLQLPATAEDHGKRELQEDISGTMEKLRGEENADLREG